MKDSHRVTERYAGCATIEELASSVSEELFTMFTRLTAAGSKQKVSEAVSDYVLTPNNTWVDRTALANLMNACSMVRDRAIPEEYVDQPVGDYMAKEDYRLSQMFR